MACACSASPVCARARSGWHASTGSAATACSSGPNPPCRTTELRVAMLKVIFLFLMSGGLPVAIAMAGSSLIYLLWAQTTPPFVVIHRMVSGIDSFPLLAVPFFILAGNLMNNAGITNRIYTFALALVGWMKGGLG